MNSEKKLQLTGDYVKNHYNDFLANLSEDYADYRWHNDPVSQSHYDQTYSALSPFFKKITGDVLEIGGGDAMWTMNFILQIQKLVFLDISKEMISRAQKRLVDFNQKIDYQNQNFLENSLVNKTFDFVISIRNLEYFLDKNKFISEVSRVLKEDGHFLLITKSPQYTAHNNTQQKTLHIAQIDINELIHLLKQNNFIIESVRPAIVGKLLRYNFIRKISSILQKIIFSIPMKLIPFKALSYFSESFLIYARKG